MDVPTSDRGRVQWPLDTCIGHASGEITVNDVILTSREREILHYIRRGLSNKEIAATVGLSVSGVRFHVTSLLRKFRVESRVDLRLLQAKRNGGFHVSRIKRLRDAYLLLLDHVSWTRFYRWITRRGHNHSGVRSRIKR